MQIDVTEVRLLLVDARGLSRAAMTAAFDAEVDLAVVVSAATLRSAVEESARSRPDVGVVDASVVRPHEPHPCAVLKDRAGIGKVVVLDDQPDRWALLAAIRADADGYMTRDEPLDAVLDAVRQVHEGQTRIPTRMLGQLLRDLSSQQRQSAAAVELLMRLTRREKEVLALLAEGCDQAAVANILTISPQTARTHIQNIIQKFGVHSRLEVTTLALEHGLTSPSILSAGS